MFTHVIFDFINKTYWGATSARQWIEMKRDNKYSISLSESDVEFVNRLYEFFTDVGEDLVHISQLDEGFGWNGFSKAKAIELVKPTGDSLWKLNLNYSLDWVG